MGSLRINPETEYEASVKNIDYKIKEILKDYVNEDYLKKLGAVICYLGKDSDIVNQAFNSFTEEQRKKILNYAKEYNNADSQVMAEIGWVINTSEINKEIDLSDLIHKQATVKTEKIRSICEEYSETNPVLVNILDANLIKFEDILLLDGRSIQRLLRKIGTEILSVALKGASDEICNKIFRNMSQRNASILKEDIEYMGPVKASKIMDAREKVSMAIRQFIDNGEIEMPYHKENNV